MPKVSVITTLYNYRAYIGDCLKSFCKQDFKDSEIIIVDDASTDNPYSIIQKYMDDCDNIKYIKLNKNMGYSHAKNVGIKASNSEILVMLDADDMLTKNGISIRYKKIQEGYDFVHGPVIDLKKRKGAFKMCGRSKMWQKWIFSNKGPKDYRYVHAQAVMLRKQIHREIGLYDEALRSKSDREMWGRIFYRGYKIGWVNKPVAIYRSHSKQMHRSREKLSQNKRLQRYVKETIRRRAKKITNVEFLV